MDTVAAIVISIAAFSPTQAEVQQPQQQQVEQLQVAAAPVDVKSAELRRDEK